MSYSVKLSRGELIKLKKNQIKILNLAIAVGLLANPVSAFKEKDISWGIPKKDKAETQPYPGHEYDGIVRENDAYYIGEADDMVVYLTFDCGYENGHLPMILDALLEKQIPALFFITGHFMESEPDLLRRMVDEGHLVGNHTYDHPNLTTVSKSEFFQEINRAEEKFFEITGQTMAKYLRPPEGRFNQEMLDWAEEAGYYTILWSLAYVDWHVDGQKGADYAHEQIMSRLHPGAIILLHSTSSDNAQVMARLIRSVEEAGYEFKSLQHLLVDDLLEENMLIIVE